MSRMDRLRIRIANLVLPNNVMLIGIGPDTDAAQDYLAKVYK